MIIFLDFDGVISTTRAFMSQVDQQDFYIRWLDPVACDFVRRICEQFSCKIVVSSTWRNFGYESCVATSMAAYGLDKFVHKDWRTEELWSRDMELGGCRPLEIATWLAGHDETEYLILDDDTFLWTEHQKERWIHTDVENGMFLSHMSDIIDRLELNTGLKFNDWKVT